MRTLSGPDHQRPTVVVWALTFGMLAALLAVIPPTSAAASFDPAALDHACPDPVPPSGFDDVGAGGTHTRAIDCLLLYGITQGVTPSRYEPSTAVNREQMATFIARLMRLTGAELATPRERRFTDVSSGQHRGNIEALAEAGVARGVTSTTFAPRDAVTRAQMATFIDRMLREIGLDLDDAAVSFADVSGGTHAPAIGRLAAAGVVQGTSADTYNPTGAVTRAQMASFLMRAADLLVAAGLLGDTGDQEGPFVAIDAGYVHTCGLLEDGTARCWGDNTRSRLGNGDFGGTSRVPVAVAGLTDAVAIAAGDEHSCAVLDDGTARCWGSNLVGQIGHGSTSQAANVPVAVSGITNAVDITAGGGHTCALLDDGTVRCWGRNNLGQHGSGTTGEISRVPVAVAGLTDAVAISAGGGHTCALRENGTVRCWGRNAGGELGDGTTDISNVPVAVSGITNATTIAASLNNGCAVLEDGTVRCWGNNAAGQLGNGTTNTGPNPPVTVSGITDAVDIAVGGGRACAVLRNGTARCWGSNFNGRLGIGITDGTFPVPVAVVGLTNAATIASFYGNHTCAVLRGGAARCWGGNDYGQLGNGDNRRTNRPVAVLTPDV